MLGVVYMTEHLCLIFFLQKQILDRNVFNIHRALFLETDVNGRDIDTWLSIRFVLCENHHRTLTFLLKY